MSAINEHTGASIVSKNSDKFRANYDVIFRKPTEVKPKCAHTYAPKMDSSHLVCVKCGQQEGWNE
jgi:hypothetical protein